uniref:Uncharacterized protein n=1 Tax=Marmota marmota marmota TaxID=9994 RepID=A0A8C6A434_MARMA
MAPSTLLLCGSGQYVGNGPPCFTDSTGFQGESRKNHKLYTFSKDGTLFPWDKKEK